MSTPLNHDWEFLRPQDERTLLGEDAGHRPTWAVTALAASRLL